MGIAILYYNLASPVYWSLRAEAVANSLRSRLLLLVSEECRAEDVLLAELLQSVLSTLCGIDFSLTL